MPRDRAEQGPRNALSVDVEDWFQVGAFEKVIARGEWDSIPRRVEANTRRVIDLFEEVGVKAFASVDALCSFIQSKAA